MYQFKSLLVLTGVLLACITAACGGSASPANTTPTSAPPPTLAPQATTPPEATATTEPTTTAQPTTAVEQPTASGGANPTTAAPPGNLPDDLANAVKKTGTVQAVRFEITENINYTLKGQPTVLPPMSFKGEGNGKDQHFAISGVMGQNGQTSSFEFIQTGGQSYVKGLELPGLDANTWYQYPQQAGDLSQAAPNAKSLLAELNPEDFRKGDFKATGIEVFDLQPCQVWTSQNQELAKDFTGLTQNEDVQRELKAMDSADFKIWTCGDGYLHQMKGVIQGHDPDKPSDKATADITFHIYDFNSSINIGAPAGAQPFVIPGLGATPTP